MIHQRISFDTSGGSAQYINDRTSAPLVPQVSPYYYIRLDAVDGLYGADISTESHPLPHDIGEKSGDVYRRGKTVTLTGTIWAINMSAVEAGADYLAAIFADVSPRKLKFLRGATPVYLTCRVNQDLSVVEALPDVYGRHAWPWTVGLRADDPRTRKVSGDTVFPTWQA